MADNLEVPDSTDWLRTPLEGLTGVEAALRCQMCKDFYKTPMLTPCSHTFCSLCIRHALANDGRCPLCRKTGQENQLRNNWSLEEAVDSFSKARKAILDFAKSDRPPPRVPRSPKRKQIATGEVSPGPEKKRLRSSARLSGAKAHEAATSKTPEDIVVLDSEDEGDIRDEGDDNDETFIPDDGLVPCPVCQTRMKQWQVFKHLDTCTGPSANHNPFGEGSTSTKPPGLPSNQLRYSPPSKPPERLAGLSYGLLKDNQLRKKLSDLGLSSAGSRQLLENRHREWITIWNANCDSAKPKKRAALLQDLASWEKTIGLGASNAMGGFAKSRLAEPEIKDKNFNGAAWALKHETSFRDLIADARKSRAKAQEKRDGADDPTAAAAAAGPSQIPLLPTISVHADKEQLDPRSRVGPQTEAAQLGHPSSVSTTQDEHSRGEAERPLQWTRESESVRDVSGFSAARPLLAPNQEAQEAQPPSTWEVPPLQGAPTG